LIHSRAKDATEAALIAKNRRFSAPLAIVPTKFPEVTNKELFDMGFSMIIWANQTERVKIKATRQALKILKEEDSAKTIENSLSATLDDMRSLCPLE